MLDSEEGLQYYLHRGSTYFLRLAARRLDDATLGQLRISLPLSPRFLPLSLFSSSSCFRRCFCAPGMTGSFNAPKAFFAVATHEAIQHSQRATNRAKSQGERGGTREEGEGEEVEKEKERRRR
eukprot:2523402-Pyramimonas_sp.AAC.1